MNNISVQENFLQIKPDCEANADSIIKEIFTGYKCTEYKCVYVDLRGFNCFKAIKLAGVISAKGLIKNHRTVYEFLIDNEFTKSQIKLLRLSNVLITK